MMSFSGYCPVLASVGWGTPLGVLLNGADPLGTVPPLFRVLRGAAAPDTAPPLIRSSPHTGSIGVPPCTSSHVSGAVERLNRVLVPLATRGSPLLGPISRTV